MNNERLYRQIYLKYQLGPAVHMTHINNIESIIRDGELRSFNLMAQTKYESLANEDVQRGRANKTIPPTKRPLHDYVPLYFGNRTPMVAWNQERNEEMVFMRFSLNIFARGDIVFTDGNARSSVTVFRVYSQVTDLEILDRKAINTVKYANNPELKRRKQAEILVPDKLPLTYLVDFICYSENAKWSLLETLKHCDKKYNVQVLPGSWYFRSQAETKLVKGSQTP